MKISVFIGLFLFSLVVLSCRHKKEMVQMVTISLPAEQASALPVTLPDSVSKDSVYRLVVSFYSIGQGPDMDAYHQFLNYIAAYQRQHNVMIKVDKKPWGREGEVDYCMPLKELSIDEQQQFILNLKKSLVEAKWVHYFENVPNKERK